MRQRVKMNGLVSHTTPNGKSYSSGRNKCEQNIKKLEKLIGEGWEITGAKKKEDKKVLTIMLGKEYKVTIEYFKKNLEPIGCKIIAEL